MTGTKREIEFLAQRAIQRIGRECKFAGRSEMAHIHARAVRNAQDNLSTTAAIPAQRLHARINELLEA